MTTLDLFLDRRRSFLAIAVGIIAVGGLLLVAVNGDSTMNSTLRLTLNGFVYMTFAVSILGAAWVMRSDREARGRSGVEIEVRRLRGQLDELITHSSTALLSVDRNGVVLDARGATIAPPGMETKDLIGQRLEDAYPNQPKFHSEVAAAMVAERPTSATMRVRHRTFELSCRPRRQPTGGFDGFNAVAHEVTARRAAEEELRRTNAILERTREELRLFRDEPAIGSVLFDHGGRVVHANKAFATMLGYHEEDLIGKTTEDFTHPADIGRTMQLSLEMRQGGLERGTIEKRFLRRDGVAIEATVLVVAWRGRDGKVDRVLAQVQDVTERNKRVRALEVAEKALVGIVNSSDDEMVVCDDDGRVVSMSRGFAEWVGGQDSDPTGSSIDQLKSTLERLGPDKELLTRWVEGELDEAREVTFTRPNPQRARLRSRRVAEGSRVLRLQRL